MSTPDDEAAAAVVAIARLSGCNCEPAVSTEPDPRHSNMPHVEVTHDDRCRLVLRNN